MDDIAKIDVLEKAIAQNVNRALWQCGMIAQRESVKNAPRSPKQSEIRRAQKARQSARRGGQGPTKRQKAAWKASRSARATTRPKPGGLERSIKMETRQEPVNWDRSEACIYVGSDAEAAKYAVKIHDEKGKTWRNRGLGTIAKGSRADEKFIERAIKDNEKTFKDKIANALGKAIEQYGHS